MTDYLDKAIDAIVAGLEMLADENGDPLLKKVQKYLYPLPTAYPHIVIYQGGDGEITPDSSDMANQSFLVVLRYVIGEVGQGYTGELQNRLWTDYPKITNHLYHHNLLNFGNLPKNGDLRGTGITVGRATKVGVFNDDQKHLAFEFPITIPFSINLRRKI